ncbi:MAG: transporter [Proteobacteria bacterium]|nr:transporter [Pseudomonadota bacterium]
MIGYFIRRAYLFVLNTVASGISIICVMVCGATPSLAIDTNSHDWQPAPAGTNLFLNYTIYTARDKYVDASGKEISGGTGLDSFVDILRYVHYMDVAGMRGVVQAIVPMGSLYNAELGGTQLNSATGIGDPIVAAALWPYRNDQTKTYLAIEPFLTIPIGQYNASHDLNLGENRWKLDLQVGWFQGLTDTLSMQLTYDVIWYGNNDDARGGNAQLSQADTHQFQAWLSYAFAPTWSASIGYQKQMGGVEYVEGIATGNATDRDQGRLELSKFISPTFQILGDVSHDFHTEGGFAEEFRGDLRLMTVF